jgi:hypothetical protein
MVHRKRKRSNGGYLLGGLPGVRQDQPKVMNDGILKGSFRVIVRGIVTPSVLNMIVNVH